MLIALALQSLLAMQNAPPPTAQPPPGKRVCRIAVLNLAGRSLGPEDVDLPVFLSELLATEVADASKCQVLSQADIKSMVDFEATRASCVDGGDSCLAELGQALGADRIVAGSIGRLGTDYVITVRLVDIGKVLVEQRAEEVVSGQPEKLRLAAKIVGRALFPHMKPAIEPAEAPAPAPAAAPPLMLYGGVGAGVVGAAGVVVGAALALDADGKLGDPNNTDKAGAFGEARAGAAVAVGGLVVAAAGGVLATLALLTPADGAADAAGGSAAGGPAAGAAAGGSASTGGAAAGGAASARGDVTAPAGAEPGSPGSPGSP